MIISKVQCIALKYSSKAFSNSRVKASWEKHVFQAQDIGVGDPSSWERASPLPLKTSYHAAMGSTKRVLSWNLCSHHKYQEFWAETDLSVQWGSWAGAQMTAAESFLQPWMGRTLRASCTRMLGSQRTGQWACLSGVPALSFQAPRGINVSKP